MYRGITLQINNNKLSIKLNDEYRKLKLAVEKLKSASIDKCTSAEVMRTP
jgi:hypothetical protein